MKLLLYKPPYYNLDLCAVDISFCPDKDMIKDAINSFFLVSTPPNLRWFETLRRDCIRREIYNDHSPTYWLLSNPKKEVFKKLEVVSV